MSQAVVDLWLIRRDSLGQREHLLVLFILPYLVLAAGRMQTKSVGKLHAAWIGLAASVAICLKPQHILVVFLVELFVLVKNRNIRTLLYPVILAFAAGMAGYSLFLLKFGRLYFENVLPRLVLTYWGMDRPYSQILLHTVRVLAGLFLCTIVLFFLRRRLMFVPLAETFGIAALVSVVAHVQQHKDWSYHLIPAGFFTVLFISLTGIGFIEQRLRSRVSLALDRQSGTFARTVVLASLAAVCFSFLGWRFGHHAGYFDSKKRTLAEVYKGYPAGSAIGYFSTELSEMPILIEQGKVLGQRMPHLWALPAIILGQDPAGNDLNRVLSSSKIDELSSYQREARAEDLAYWKPVVVVIDQCGPDLCPALQREHYGTVLGWFLRGPDFQREWQHYIPISAIGDLEVFRRSN